MMHSARRTGFDVNLQGGVAAFRETGIMAAVSVAAVMVVLSVLVA